MRAGAACQRAARPTINSAATRPFHGELAPDAALVARPCSSAASRSHRRLTPSRRAPWSAARSSPAARQRPLLVRSRRDAAPRAHRASPTVAARAPARRGTAPRRDAEATPVLPVAGDVHVCPASPAQLASTARVRRACPRCQRAARQQARRPRPRALASARRRPCAGRRRRRAGPGRAAGPGRPLLRWSRPCSCCSVTVPPAPLARRAERAGRRAQLAGRRQRPLLVRAAVARPQAERRAAVAAPPHASRHCAPPPTRHRTPLLPVAGSVHACAAAPVLQPASVTVVPALSAPPTGCRHPAPLALASCPTADRRRGSGRRGRRRGGRAARPGRHFCVVAPVQLCSVTVPPALLLVAQSALFAARSSPAAVSVHC